MIEQSLLSINNDQPQRFINHYDEDIEIGPRRLSSDGITICKQVQDDSQKINFLFTSITIIKTSIGSGILALPYTVSKCGVILSIIIFIIATSMSQFSATILLKAKNLSGHSNFTTILYHIFQNRKAKVFGSIFIAFGNMGICIAAIIIIKKTIFKMLNQILPVDSQSLDQFYTSEIFIAFVFAFLQFPFLWGKKIEKLKSMALVGVIGLNMFLIAFLVNYAFASLDEDPMIRPVGGMEMFPSDWFAAAASIPTVIFSLSFVYNFFPIYKGMSKTSDSKMKQATLVSTIICSIFYLVVGILGYNLIGNGVKCNFLESVHYNATNPIIYFIINFGFLLSIYLTFPIVFFGSRNNFITLIDCFINRNDQGQQQQTNSSTLEDTVQIQKRKEKISFAVKTLAIYIVIQVFGILANDITVVYNAIGAICSTSNLFFLPYSFYILLVRKMNKPKKIYYYLALSISIVMVPFAIFTMIAKYTYTHH